jgi:hypothetical protein
MIIKEAIKYFDKNSKVGETVVLELPSKFGDKEKLIIGQAAEYTPLQKVDYPVLKDPSDLYPKIP